MCPYHPIGKEGTGLDTDLKHPTRCGRCGTHLQVRVDDSGQFYVGCPTVGHEQYAVDLDPPSGEWEAEV